MNWRSPTETEMASPEFKAIWDCIKTWDVNVPEVYSGYRGANGNHVCAILDAIRNQVIEECAREIETQTKAAAYPLTVELARQMAAAIRALKDREQDIKKTAVSNQWRCKLCGALTYGSQCDNCKHTPSDYPTR